MMRYRPSKTESIRVSPVTAIALLLRPSTENGLHQLLRDRRRRRAAEAVLVLERDGDRDLRVVGRREADEPRRVDAAVARLRGTGLARDRDARNRGGPAGAVVDSRDHHRGDLVCRSPGHDPPQPLRVDTDDRLAARVD